MTAAIAESSIAAGVSQVVGQELDESKFNFSLQGPVDVSLGTPLNTFVSGVAGGIASAATRSVLTGTDFGDNIVATLPGVIGQTIGNALAYQIGQGSNSAAQGQQAPGTSANSPTGANGTGSTTPTLLSAGPDVGPIPIKPFDLSSLDVTINLSSGGGSGSGGTTGSAASIYGSYIIPTTPQDIPTPAGNEAAYNKYVTLALQASQNPQNGGKLPADFATITARFAQNEANVGGPLDAVSSMRLGLYALSSLSTGDIAPYGFASSPPQFGSLEDIIGKTRALPYTIAGLAIGGVNTAIGYLEGNPDAGISFDHNSIQFVGGAFAQPDVAKGGTFYSGSRGGAFTLGNVEIYGGQTTPTSADYGYTGNLSPVDTQDHEVQHTYQYQDMGLSFLPKYMIYGIQSPSNPFEQAADRGARGGNPYPYDLIYGK